MSTLHAEVAVIGAGIVGLAHAWAAARRGLSVLLFERGAKAHGASVRNFGMVWPIGQPAGEPFFHAMRSRDRWIELSQKAGVWVNDCGSLHLASAPDELAVLEEFVARADDLGISCELLTPTQTQARCPAVRSENVLGSLYSPTECCVDPRQAIAKIPNYLAENFKVGLHFNTQINRVEGTTLVAADGRNWHADRVFVCSGSDFETLFPASFINSGVRRCKLQMLRTVPQPGRWRLGPHVAGGLTLCHYTSFEGCPTLPKLRERIHAQLPEYVHYGIHVMASQNHLGEVVIGDSHEYDEAIEVFDKERIDVLILDYLRKMIRLPDEQIAARWHGIYSKFPRASMFTTSPQPGVTIQVAPGGAGMTLSFGLADAWWDMEG